MSSPKTHKLCRICGLKKPFEDFHRATGMKDGHRNECRDCTKKLRRENYLKNRKEYIARAREWQRRNPERHRAYQEKRRREKGVELRAQMRAMHLERKYGLTVDDYGFLVVAQGGRCAACDRLSDDLHVDHEHGTGRVRGLLCGSCNRGIGLLGDDPGRLESAAAYLRRSQYPLGCGDRSSKPRGKPRT